LAVGQAALVAIWRQTADGTGHRYGNAGCTWQGGVLSSLWSPGRRFSFSSAMQWEAAGWAGVAQLVEHLICNQRVGGSNPFASSKVSSRSAGGCAARLRSQCGFLSREALSQRIYQEGRTRKVYRERRSTVRRSVPGVKTGREDFRGGLKRLSGSLKVCAGRALRCRHYKSFHAQVGERLKPTDCKSVGLKVYEGSNPSLCTIFCRPVGAWLAGCSV